MSGQKGYPMVRKKLATRLLAGALLAAVLPLPMSGAARAADSSFTDVASGAWYAGAVSYVYDNGLMSGLSGSIFAPDLSMSRAMLATVLYRLAGSPAVTGQDGFTDTEDDAWYASAVLWAQQNGYVTGYSAQTFGTNDPVTREQMATILWRYCGSPEAGAASSYDDGEQISDWAVQAVDWASETEIISGKPGNTFDPAGQATRAEAAMILTRYDQNKPEPEPPVETPEETPETPEETPGEEEALPPEESTEPDPEPDVVPLPPNPYDSEAFVLNENGFLTYEGNAASYIGIDVSSHQKLIDWDKVAAAGVEFALIRVGYRGYSVGSIVQDPYFTYSIENAARVGIDVGVYFFSQAVNEEEAIEEAYQTLAWIEDYELEYPVVFDWEYISDSSSRTYNMTYQEIIDCTKAFCQVIEEAGYQPMTYSNPYLISKGFDLSQLLDYPFWLAHYTTNCAPTSFAYYYDMWQYSSTGRVDGIEGNVDLNICLVNW